MDCFSDDFLAAYLERTVSARELAEAEAHLGACRDCSAHVAAFARLAARESEVTQRDPGTAVAGPSDAHERHTTVPGRIIAGRYLIEGRLGGGGMGVVYRAHDQLMDRRVAIKVIAPRFSHNRQAEPRFLRECRLAARMSHLNAVMVLDHGRLDEGQLYLAMELLIGRTLQEHLQTGPLGEPRALHIASQICDALDAAHRLQIIHRDLKPGNIMLLDDPPGRDFVKVLDFGIARSLVSEDGDLTRTDVIIGTPDFSAPEVFGGRGDEVDQRADIYSLGIVLYWMLACRPPFAVTGDQRGPHGLAPLDSASPEVGALIDEMLAIDPSRRPSTAAEVRARLDHLQAAPHATPPPSEQPGFSSSFVPSTIETLPTEIAQPAWPQPAAIPRRGRVVMPLVVVALLSAALGLTLWAVARPRHRSRRPAAPPPVQATTVEPTPAPPPPVETPPPPPPDIATEPAIATAVPPAAADAGPATDSPPRPSSRPKRSKPTTSRHRPPEKTSPPSKKPDARPEYFRP